MSEQSNAPADWEMIERVAENHRGAYGEACRLALRLRAEVERLRKRLSEACACKFSDGGQYATCATHADADETIARLTAERDEAREQLHDCRDFLSDVRKELGGQDHDYAPGLAHDRMAELRAAKARSAELERALRKIVVVVGTARSGHSSRGTLAVALRDVWTLCDEALAKMGENGDGERPGRGSSRSATTNAPVQSKAAPILAVDITGDLRLDTGLAQAAIKRNAALAAPEPEESAGDEGSRATGRSPGAVRDGSGHPNPRARQAEAAPADPEEPRCGACQYNDDGECTRWCDACYFSNGGVPTDARKRPEEPRCPTCGGDQWLTERAPQVGVEPIIGSRTIPCPACRPRYVQPPTHDAESAPADPEEPRCPTCGGKRHIPCHYAYQGCLSPGEYQTEGGQRVCARHAQIANDISGLDSWLCLENACPDCQPEGSRSHDASTCGGPETCTHCAVADEHDDGQGLKRALLSHFGYDEAVRRLEAPTTRPEPEPTCHTCGHIESAHLHEIHEGARWCDIHECPCPNYACQPEGEGSETE